MVPKRYSNGKLLLTGEYLVLDGGLSLALPTRYGQSMDIAPIASSELIWESIDYQGKAWFKAVFHLSTLAATEQNEVALRLQHILREAQKLNPQFLRDTQGFAVRMKLDFPRDWGLGSSSTLINNIAQWASVDAHELLWNSFSGSGYDISCAQHDLPILYQLQNNTSPKVTEVHFDPPFKDQLYFIYLNKKQNSRDGIAQYKKRNFDTASALARIFELTSAIVSCKKIVLFEKLLSDHEALLSAILGIPTIKETIFSDYPRAIKSLGAWGGDFVLVTGSKKEMDYFSKKGFHTIIPYEQMILS